MKQVLTARLSQQITLTPQLQQAIRLLQLSAQDLAEEIQKALESNPMLETDTDMGEENNSNFETSTESATAEMDSFEAPTAEVASSEKESDNAYEDTPFPESAEWPSDNAGQRTYDDSEQRTAELKDNRGTSLVQRLLWQMRLTPFSKTDASIAFTLIDAIADDGYLRSSLEDIQISLAQLDIHVELEEIEAVLKRIQQFEPLGVGSRNLQEFLLFQLNQLDPESEFCDIAQNIVTNHLELLARHDYKLLRSHLKIDEETLFEAINLIRSLSARPNYEISEEQPDFIIPDVIVYKHHGKWQVELNQRVTPTLHINRNYASLLRAGKNEIQYQQLRDQLQEARWLVKSIASRNETLLKVTACIIERQKAFLEHGPVAMKPMILQDVAQETELHESTVSRITTQKYMQTPQGIFELKYFFSSHVSTHSGQDCSSTAIRAFIKRLIAQEIQDKPLSDNQIAKRLETEQGIKIARRTITKYRESLGIISSSERRKCKHSGIR